MKVPRLHVDGFPLLLLSIMALTSACVDGKCSGFFYYKDHFFCFPKLLEESYCDGTSDVENSSTDDSNSAS